MDRKNTKLDPNNFYSYFTNTVLRDCKEKKFLWDLLEVNDLYLFGGVIRDYYFGKGKEPRDIDIVVEEINQQIVDILKPYMLRRTRFGGYKVLVSGKEYDIWTIDNTWGVKNSEKIKSLREISKLKYEKKYGNLGETLPLFNDGIYNMSDKEKLKYKAGSKKVLMRSMIKQLPRTSFFNITAILYSIRERKFIKIKNYNNIKNTNILDIVLVVNPYPELCIVKSYEYYKTQNFILSERLKSYIIRHYELTRKDIERVQQKHYGDVCYDLKEMDKFYEGLVRERMYIEGEDNVMQGVGNGFEI